MDEEVDRAIIRDMSKPTPTGDTHGENLTHTNNGSVGGSGGK